MNTLALGPARRVTHSAVAGRAVAVRVTTSETCSADIDPTHLHGQVMKAGAIQQATGSAPAAQTLRRQDEGFYPSVIGDPPFLRDPATGDYRPIDHAVYARLVEAESGSGVGSESRFS